MLDAVPDQVWGVLGTLVAFWIGIQIFKLETKIIQRVPTKVVLGLVAAFFGFVFAVALEGGA
jgi:hypothetical protein